MIMAPRIPTKRMRIQVISQDLHKQAKEGVFVVDKNIICLIHAL